MSVRLAIAQAAVGDERLWKVWWIAGIPMALTTSALLLVAEHLRYAGFHGWGALLDVARLFVYFAWFRLAWRCSRNVERPFWTRISRCLLAAGLVMEAAF
jgi:hypothetical protein